MRGDRHPSPLQVHRSRLEGRLVCRARDDDEIATGVEVAVVHVRRPRLPGQRLVRLQFDVDTIRADRNLNRVAAVRTGRGVEARARFATSTTATRRPGTGTDESDVFTMPAIVPPTCISGLPIGPG